MTTSKEVILVFINGTHGPLKRMYAHYFNRY